MMVVMLMVVVVVGCGISMYIFSGLVPVYYQYTSPSATK